jgi:hypothetical protein
MKKFKELAYTDKTIALQQQRIYTVICNTRKIRKGLQLKEELKKLLGVDIIKVRKINAYSKGQVKLYVKVREPLSWLMQ